ncbi:hypothetical protein JGU66_08510 [Myxococcaceae bacterium JPH2]|nr:hypothetical protein [Myxococcaceae bacterium JPH2]
MSSREDTPWSAVNGLLFGVAAGAVFALAEMALATAAGEGPSRPVRMAAAVLLGTRAFTPQVSMGVAAAVGLGMHLVLSAAWGVLYSLVDSRLPPDGRGRWEFQAAVGMLFGMFVWMVDFQFVARGYFPWFLDVPQFTQVVMHAVFWGLSLALLFTAAERRRTVMADEPIP